MSCLTHQEFNTKCIYNNRHFKYIGCTNVEQSKLLFVLIVNGLFYVGHTAIIDLDFVLVEDLA